MEIRKKWRDVYDGSDGPVMYAHMLTKASVRQAPASPDRMYRVLRNAGNTLSSHGITCSDVRSAITPAMNPKNATNPKTFNLSPNFFTFAYIRILSSFLV